MDNALTGQVPEPQFHMSGNPPCQGLTLVALFE
jgi:hypothetical protein